MKNLKSIIIVILITALSGFAFGFIQSNSLKPKMVLPSEVKWVKTGEMETAVLEGNPKQEGLYVMRVKIPANTKLLPHWHPEDRTVVILSGTFYYNYGEKFDESKMKEISTGTFFTEPSKQPHYACTKNSEVVLHVTGWGPTGTTYLNQSEKK